MWNFHIYWYIFLDSLFCSTNLLISLKFYIDFILMPSNVPILPHFLFHTFLAILGHFSPIAVLRILFVSVVDWAVLPAPPNTFACRCLESMNVMLFGKRDFVVNDFEMGRWPWIILWVQCITKTLVRGRQEELVGREVDVMTAAGTGGMCFENGGSGRKPRNLGGRKKLRQARIWILSLNFPGRTSPVNTLTVAWETDFAHVTFRTVRE